MKQKLDLTFGFKWLTTEIQKFRLNFWCFQRGMNFSERVVLLFQNACVTETGL